jgi:TPR repeat protein
LAAYEVWVRTQTVDFQIGLTYLKIGAEQGYAPACLTLGKMLHDGAMMARDVSGALLLFEMAAAGGSAAGWNSMGVCYEEQGKLVDAQRCYRWAPCLGVQRSIRHS